ncbi:MAG: DUF374 domain-containing protein [Candidatus Kapabacteria bacterium]|nr:DUF374 domain-containing protein [Candidatus Kapabacteria bacterium]
MKAGAFSALVRLLARSWRMHIEGSMPSGPCIIAFWHGEMLPVLATFGPLHSIVLVSPSNDGKVLQQLLRDWGHTIVEGSSSRGGKQALEQLVALAPQNIILITPDGPRGPAHVAKPGAVITAQRSGVPIVHVRIRATPVITFSRSWDRFQVPLPFARITMHLSEPIHVPSNLSEDETSAEIRRMDERMHQLGSITC